MSMYIVYSDLTKNTYVSKRINRLIYVLVFLKRSEDTLIEADSILFLPLCFLVNQDTFLVSFQKILVFSSPNKQIYFRSTGITICVTSFTFYFLVGLMD